MTASNFSLSCESLACMIEHQKRLEKEFNRDVVQDLFFWREKIKLFEEEYNVEELGKIPSQEYELWKNTGQIPGYRDFNEKVGDEKQNSHYWKEISKMYINQRGVGMILGKTNDYTFYHWTELESFLEDNRRNEVLRDTKNQKTEISKKREDHKPHSSVNTAKTPENQNKHSSQASRQGIDFDEIKNYESVKRELEEMKRKEIDRKEYMGVVLSFTGIAIVGGVLTGSFSFVIIGVLIFVFYYFELFKSRD